MSDIHVTIENNGRLISEKSFPLQGNLDDLDAIDESVDLFKKQALPFIEKVLFAESQQQCLSDLKKTVDSP